MGRPVASQYFRRREPGNRAGFREDLAGIGSENVDVAVNAARRAFTGWSQSTREERLDLLQAILRFYQKRADDLAEAVTEEIGAPPSPPGRRSPSGSVT